MHYTVLISRHPNIIREYRSVYIKRTETGLGGKRKYCYQLYKDPECKRWIECQGSRPDQGDFNTLTEAKACIDFMIQSGELD